MQPILVRVSDKMQSDYIYERSEAEGKNFHSDFHPQLSPPKMLQLGVFGGKYMSDCNKEFPSYWFEKAQLNSQFHDPKINFFSVNASQSLSVWRAKGWIYHEDPRGWFQWYCRYFMGRRCKDDERQIKRWRQMRRHLKQVEKNCKPKDLICRPKQRQALLHWAYDSIKL